MNCISMKTRTSVFLPRLYPWLVWLVAASTFFSGYCIRIAPGVMAVDMMYDLHANALMMGMIGAYYYYPYLAMQLPVGLLVDRFSAKFWLIMMAVITALGCIVLARTNQIFVVYLSRISIGFAGAFAFIGAVKLSLDWHPPTRMSLIIGLTQGCGMMGAALGGPFIAQWMGCIGWRQVFVYMSYMFLILALLLIGIVRSKPQLRTTVQPVSLLKQLSVILANKQSWYNALFAGFMFAPTTIFAEWWGVHYLQQIHTLPLSLATWANSCIFVGWALGGPLMGWISDMMKQRRLVMQLAALFGSLDLLVIFLCPSLSYQWLCGLLFFYGISNAGLVVAYTSAAEIAPPGLNGTALALVNMLSVVIGALLQPIVGWLLDTFAVVELSHLIDVGTIYSPIIYQRVMLLLPALLLLAVGITTILKETYVKP